MEPVDRRTFLLLAAVAPLALPSAASAGLKMPTRVPPRQLRPLGLWRAVDARPEVEAGQTAVVELAFRSNVDVAEPYYNWWPRSLPTVPFPPPPTPIPVGSPQRPADLPFPYPAPPEPLMVGLWTPVLIEIPVAANTCPGGYRITVQMSDGPVDSHDPARSRRRALFTFVLRVSGTACARPTAVPHPTRTPRLPPPAPTRTPTP